MESQITLKSRGNLPDSHPCFLQYTGKPSGFRRIPDKFFSQLGRCGGGVNPLNTSSMFSFLSTCESFPTMGIPGLLSRILVVASDSHIDGSHGASTALCNPYYRFSRGPWISRGDRQGPKTQSSFSKSLILFASLNSWRGLVGLRPHRFPRE